MKKNILFLTTLTVLILSFHFLGINNYISLSFIQGQKENFKIFYTQHPVLTPLLFSGLYIISTALSLPIATLLTLLGGFLFGLYLGTFLVTASATIGACILFLIARSTFGASLRQKASRLYTQIEKEMTKNGFNYLLFLRLVPVFPFVLVNIAPALFNMRLSTYIFATYIGIFPASAIYVNIGTQLGGVSSLSGLISPKVLLSFALLGLLALTPIIIKKWKNIT